MGRPPEPKRMVVEVAEWESLRAEVAAQGRVIEAQSNALNLLQGVPCLTLCNTQAKKGIAVTAVGGECPVHGGDACLFVYAEVVGLRRVAAGGVMSTTDQGEK